MRQPACFSCKDASASSMHYPTMTSKVRMLIATEASKIHHEPIHPKFTGLSVLHDLDPEYAKFSLEALNETAKAIRDFASKLSARDAPLPLSASYRESFREASPREIQGLDGEGVLRALFEDTADDALLKEVITQGFMEYNPSVPSRRKLVFQAVIRGTQVGIFSDV